MSYKVIPQIEGPPLTTQPPAPSPVCFLEVEVGTGLFVLERGGFLQLETCRPVPPETFLFELENGTGTILLQDGVGSLELEVGP